LNGNFNKNYRLLFEGLYGGTKMDNQCFKEGREEIAALLFSWPRFQKILERVSK
jgi:hypothetical protein